MTATLDAPCPPALLFGWVDDLERYPAWLGMVRAARPTDGDVADRGPAWLVDLRGRLGPLTRSKRLRMVRTSHDPPRTVRFERAERDGRDHAAWALGASLTANGGRSHLVMDLHYGGSLFAPVLERLLREEIERARPRLLDLVGGAPCR